MTPQSTNPPCHRRSARLMKIQQKGPYNIDDMATKNLQKQPTIQRAVQGDRKTKTAKKLLKGNSDEDDHVEANVKHNHRRSIPCSKEWQDNHKRERRDQNKADNKRQKMMSPKNATKPDEPSTATASAITINPEMLNAKETYDATIKMDDIHQCDTMANDNLHSEQNNFTSLIQQMETNLERTWETEMREPNKADHYAENRLKFSSWSYSGLFVFSSFWRRRLKHAP